MAKAEDRGDYFRVPLDTRSLDYGLYFEKGDRLRPDVDDYTSHNTKRLDVAAVIALLLDLPEIMRERGAKD
jgi:UDP-N-acetylglucosamine 4,6-dehydratase/5-epimerase